LSNPDPAKFGPFVQDHHLEIRDMMMRFAEDRLAPGAQERDQAATRFRSIWSTSWQRWAACL
jgi:hypothetical protein